MVYTLLMLHHALHFLILQLVLQLVPQVLRLMLEAAHHMLLETPSIPIPPK